MRIAHVITRLIIGGAQENTVLTCEGLAERGHDVVLITGPTTGPEGSIIARARSGFYRFEEIPNLVRPVDPIRDGRALFDLTHAFERFHPDVVHTHSSKAGVLGRIAAKWAGVPRIVHTIHGMSFNRTQPHVVQAAYRWSERYCSEISDALVCVADAMTRQSLDAGIGHPGQFITIRSGMETEQFDPAQFDREAIRAEWGVGESDILVGTVARLFINKGYEQLIDIMEIVARREPRLRFLWVGDGADRARYENELRTRGLRDRVILTGLLPPAQMPRTLAAIDLLAHTSQWEGLPRVVVQALLMEKPAVSFDMDGAPEVVLPGRTGELVALGDLRGFAEALLNLAAHPERRRDYGRLGRIRCLRDFDRTVMVQSLESLYLRITATD